MKLYELLADTGISFGLLKEDTEIVSITCDSRRVEEGCLFVCIEGTAVDGHRFAESDALFQLFFQIPHLGLALGASAKAIALMLALGRDKFNVVVLCNLFADLF